MRSKRGFYIGRASHTTHTLSTNNNRTKAWTGRMGKGMIFSSLLVTLDPYKKAHKS